ncbi:unnamed protein product, partial [Rotaria sordida]
MKDVIELVDLPDELILFIMKKVNPRMLLLCSMIGIGNNRLEALAFDICHSIDLTFDYPQAPHRLFRRRFFSHVMPRISYDIQSLRINLNHIQSIKTFVENNCNGTLPNLTHLKIMLGTNQVKTGIPYTIAIGVQGTTPNHFIDGFFLERNILPYMPRLRQFNYHIRSILKNASHITIDQIRQSFLKQQQPFDCVLDNFNNNYGQCQIYSLPFIGTRLDFVSNRFPLFDINKTFSNITILLLFDDVKPFESIFFERVARALPQLRTLEIFNQLEQQEKTTAKKISIDFTHLAVLILYDIHIDYAQQFLCQIHLPSLIELVINKDILLTIIDENQQQARDNCSRVGTIRTSKPS